MAAPRPSAPVGVPQPCTPFAVVALARVHSSMSPSPVGSHRPHTSLFRWAPHGGISPHNQLQHNIEIEQSYNYMIYNDKLLVSRRIDPESRANYPTLLESCFKAYTKKLYN